MGRISAKPLVVAALAERVPRDWPLHAIEIASETSGMPYARIAPEAGPLNGFSRGARLPISVSISHAEGTVLCAAIGSAPTSGGARPVLGVDLGLVEPRSPGFLETFLTGEEQRFVREGPLPERDLRANLVWCAKEAVLKALGLGLTVDTLGLSCLPEADGGLPAGWRLAPADEEWRSFTARCSPTLMPGGGTIRGAWRSFPPFVGTLAIVWT